jgi:hypothetical protein
MSDRRMHGGFGSETGRTECVKDVGVDGRIMVMLLTKAGRGLDASGTG